MEKNIMAQKPRLLTSTFFNFHELGTSILQGLVISAATLFVYQYAVGHSYSEPVTRTMVFITLISANIFLTLVNRSFYDSIFTTLRYRNNLVPLIIGITMALTVLVVLIPNFRELFQFEVLTGRQILIATLTGCISVLWYEIVKLTRRLPG